MAHLVAPRLRRIVRGKFVGVIQIVGFFDRYLDVGWCEMFMPKVTGGDDSTLIRNELSC
jgi:hypothetical protein